MHQMTTDQQILHTIFFKGDVKPPEDPTTLYKERNTWKHSNKFIAKYNRLTMIQQIAKDETLKSVTNHKRWISIDHQRGRSNVIEREKAECPLVGDTTKSLEHRSKCISRSPFALISPEFENSCRHLSSCFCHRAPRGYISVRWKRRCTRCNEQSSGIVLISVLINQQPSISTGRSGA